MSAFSNIKVYTVRIRLPSGRTGSTAVLANNFTTASELADSLFPNMVLTMPTLEGELAIDVTKPEEPNG